MFGRGGLDPKKMQKMMRQMGIEMEELSNVQEVIIRMPDKELVIPNAEVSITKMKGQKTYQVMGKAEERELETKEKELEIGEEDLELIIKQTNADKETAEKALKETDGDIAQAIMNIKEK